MFQFQEINGAESEMCRYLGWELNIDPLALKEDLAALLGWELIPGLIST